MCQSVKSVPLLKMGCHKNPNPKRTGSLVFKPTEAKGENPNGDNFQQDKPNVQTEITHFILW